MTKATLPQAVPPCEDVVLDVLNAATGPLTQREITDAVRAKVHVPVAEIRAAVQALQDDELVDSEKFRHLPKQVFFPMHRSPFGARLVPAHEVPPLGLLQPTSWLSALGAEA